MQSVLEGSILRARDRLRVTAQLIDAVKGHHLWSERYDREPKDLFGILDDLTKNIVTALHINLTWGESARMLSKGTENIEAYLKVFEALWYTGQTTREGLNRARQLSGEAIYSMAGRDEEARATAKEVLRINPNFSSERYITAIAIKDPVIRERIEQALKKAELSSQP